MKPKPTNHIININWSRILVLVAIVFYSCYSNKKNCKNMHSYKLLIITFVLFYVLRQDLGYKRGRRWGREGGGGKEEGEETECSFPSMLINKILFLLWFRIHYFQTILLFSSIQTSVFPPSKHTLYISCPSDIYVLLLILHNLWCYCKNGTSIHKRNYSGYCGSTSLSNPKVNWYLRSPYLPFWKVRCKL